MNVVLGLLPAASIVALAATGLIVADRRIRSRVDTHGAIRRTELLIGVAVVVLGVLEPSKWGGLAFCLGIALVLIAARPVRVRDASDAARPNEGDGRDDGE